LTNELKHCGFKIQGLFFWLRTRGDLWITDYDLIPFLSSDNSSACFWLLAGNFCLDPQQSGPTDSISIKAVLTW